MWYIYIMEYYMPAQSCPTHCYPMDYSLPGSSVHGIFQVRILEWVAISFSRGSSQPRDRTQVLGRLSSEPPGKPFISVSMDMDLIPWVQFQTGHSYHHKSLPYIETRIPPLERNLCCCHSHTYMMEGLVYGSQSKFPCELSIPSQKSVLATWELDHFFLIGILLTNYLCKFYHAPWLNPQE